MKTGARQEAIGKSKKKCLGFALCALLHALCISAQAQQPKKLPRIGYLSLGTSQAPERLGTFRQGLREFGYVEGQNIILEIRTTEGRRDRVPDVMAELVNLKPDLIVTAGAGARAAVQLTKTIPIVALGTSDIVARGLVASLARPGGNVTGLSAFSPELTGKRLELLKETFPKISRVSYLFDLGDPSHVTSLNELHGAAGALSATIQPRGVQHPDELEQAFLEMGRERSDGLLTATGGLTNTNRKRIVDLAAKIRIPAVYHVKEFVDDGGLMSYGISVAEMYRRSAYYVDRILKGAKPTDLPVEQPKKFEFVINLKTAKQIGLAIPPNVLARADKVIR
jgi:putative tryptophan/tyrosine transport system substrate-binding protein